MFTILAAAMAFVVGVSVGCYVSSLAGRSLEDEAE